MNWLHIYLPFANIEVFFPSLLLIGFSVGVIGSFLGVGGAWLVTPALNILGFPMAYAVGSDITHIAGKSIFATIQHSRFGNIDYKLGLIMLFGTIIGIEAGAQLILFLEKLLIIDSVVRWSYVIFLFFIAIVMLYDYLKENQKRELGIQWHKKLQKLPIPPFIYFEVSNLTCSLWLPIFIGFFTGFLSGFLGIGGGLFRLPALVYLMGCPVIIAVGTDLFEIMISGLYGTISYSMKEKVDFIAVIIMLIGAALGVHIGAVATKYIDSLKIKFLFIVAVFSCLLSILLKIYNYKLLSSICIFISISFMSIKIIYVFIKNHLLKKIRQP